MDFCLARQKTRSSIVGPAMLLTMVVTSFGSAFFLPCLELRRCPEFAFLTKQDRTKWPRCMFWLGSLASRLDCSPNWLLLGCGGKRPCISKAERSLCPDLICTDSSWHLHFGTRMMLKIWQTPAPDQPNIWSDGGWEPVPNLDIEGAGAGHSHILRRKLSTPINGDMPRNLTVTLRAAATFLRESMVCYKRFKGRMLVRDASIAGFLWHSHWY